jgi:thiol-disulfide isomerase/thioredoxin
MAGPRSRLPPLLGATLPLLGLLLLLAVLEGPSAAAERLTLPGLDGDRLSEADLEVGWSIVVVWASWSPRCRDIAPRLDALAGSWSAEARVASVVFQEEPETIRRFLGGHRLRSRVYFDRTGAFSKKHAVTSLPGLLVFRDGRVVFRGKLPADPDPVIGRAFERDDES